MGLIPDAGQGNMNTITQYTGRLGNNIQQICNGILYSLYNNEGFLGPDHELIHPIIIGTQDEPVEAKCFFFYETFHLDIDYVYCNIKSIAQKHVLPKFKFKIQEPFDDDTIVIHIRSGDIFDIIGACPYANYVPNPLVYYLKLIKRFKKTIIVTENDNFNPVVEILKTKSDIVFQSSTVANDFATLLRAKNLASSGVGTFAVAAALCSSNLKTFHCSNLYLKEHLNPEMLMRSKTVDVIVHRLDDYLCTWINSLQDRQFIIDYTIKHRPEDHIHL